VGRDVIPPKDERAGIVTTSDGPDGLGGTLWRWTAHEPIDGTTSLVGVERQHGLVAGTRPCRRLLLDRPSPSGAGWPVDRQRQEGRDPERGTSRVEGNALKGEAQGRSGASRAGRIGGGRREGGIQTSDVARGGGGTRRHSSGSADPRLCRRASKPRRGSIAGRFVRRLRLASRRCDAGLQGHVSEGARKCMGGRRLASAERTARKTTTRRASKRRTGRAGTRTRPGLPGSRPRSTAKPHERPSRVAERRR
jgi:hypothetical protein